MYGYGYVQPTTYTTTTYTQPVAFGAPVTSYVTLPTAYSPVMYNYVGIYDRYSPFVVPYGVPSHIAQRMIEASNIFRTFDINYSGLLDKHEFFRAMWSLGYYMTEHQAKNLFYMIDRDGSGRINEREFCEYWISTHPW